MTELDFFKYFASLFYFLVGYFLGRYHQKKESCDPVKTCVTYKEHGCSHVDGFLCDPKTCKEYKNVQPTKIYSTK
jgi:hypothetical protein